jgi:hypothetical protein
MLRLIDLRGLFILSLACFNTIFGNTGLRFVKFDAFHFIDPQWINKAIIV